MKSYHIDHVRLDTQEQIGLHAQSTWELDYVIRGRGLRTLGTRQMPFREGEVVLVRPGLPHVWQFDPADGGIENISVTFTDDFLYAIRNTFPELTSVVDVIQQLPAAIVLSGQSRRRAALLLTRMPEQTEPAALLTLLSVLHLISESTDRETVGCFATDSEASRRLKDIDIYIVCNHARDITLADIARHVGMNTSSLCSFYKRHTGQTVVSRLTTVRMEQAKYLLSHTDRSVSSVCYAVGYNDLPHFCRVFRREVGQSPSEYRAAHG